jgi:hypothetical protein
MRGPLSDLLLDAATVSLCAQRGRAPGRTSRARDSSSVLPAGLSTSFSCLTGTVLELQRLL